MSAPLNVLIPDLQAGDVVLTRTEQGWLGKTIRWFSARKSGAARVNHAVCMIDDRWCIEALTRVKTRRFFDAYLDVPLVVWRPRVRGDIALAVAEAWLTQEARGYAWLKLPLFALDSLIPGQHYPFTRFVGLSAFKVCSNLVAWGFQKVTGRVWFGLDWRSVSPDHIDDWAEKHPEEWECVFSSLP